jgi:hypothetical protein
MSIRPIQLVNLANEHLQMMPPTLYQCHPSLIDANKVPIMRLADVVNNMSHRDFLSQLDDFVNILD